MSRSEPDILPTTLPRRPVPLVGADGPRVSIRLRKVMCLGILGLAAPILALSGGNQSSADIDPPAAAEVVDNAVAAPATATDAGASAAPSTTATDLADSTDGRAPALPSTVVTTKPSVATSTTGRPSTTTTRPPTTSTEPPTTGKAKARPVSGSFLQCVRLRESRGNYQAVNPSSGTGGAYQFHQATWDQTAKSMGRTDLVGTRPERAAPSTQDLVASTLYQQSGTAPWGGGCVPPTDG